MRPTFRMAKDQRRWHAKPADKRRPFKSEFIHRAFSWKVRGSSALGSSGRPALDSIVCENACSRFAKDCWRINRFSQKFQEKLEIQWIKRPLRECAEMRFRILATEFRERNSSEAQRMAEWMAQRTALAKIERKGRPWTKLKETRKSNL